MATVTSTSTLEQRIAVTLNRFNHSCSQLRILNQQIREIQFRYKRAKGDIRTCFRRSARIRLSVVEGVCGMYLEYSLMLADRLDQLYTQAGEHIIGAHPEEWDDYEDGVEQ